MFTINSATNPNDRNLNNDYLKHFKNNKLYQELKKQITPTLISDAIKEAISQSKKTKKGYKLEFTIDGIKPVELKEK